MNLQKIIFEGKILQNEKTLRLIFGEDALSLGLKGGTKRK